MEISKMNLYNIRRLCQDSNAESLLKYLISWNLIPKEGTYMCPKCGNPLQLIKNSNRCDAWLWRCRSKVSVRKQKRKLCSTERSLRFGTFFSKTKLSICKVLCFANMWVRNASLQFITDELEISSHTAVDWASFCREVLLISYMSEPEKLGGPGKIVEIDESKFGKRKYHRGHFVEGQWVFGGFERGSGRVFMVAVEQRDHSTLIPIIKDWIEPGTTIISDFWKTYDCLNQLDYIHLKVNHSINFKDPETGAHTNSIECSWRHAKAVTVSNGRKKSHIPGNLARYMFYKRCKESNLDRTTEFFKLAGKVYDARNPGDFNDNEEHVAEEDEDESDLNME